MSVVGLLSVAVLVSIPATGGVPPSPGSSQQAPLKGVIHLSTGARRAAPFQKRPKTVTLDQLKQKFNDLSGNAQKYESGAAAMPGIAKDCATKAYSVQDQVAAGCKGTDTLDQCQEKLYKHCVESYSVPAVDLPTGGINPITGGSTSPHLPGFSTKEFQQAALATSAEARALSQLLARYANEVDANAKALVP
jgi:hypothetical protein